jgi:small-conductance mechanosensitive channel
MGTVESFSLRSVKLRHHRGSIFIIPFGELGAVQNMSRDWVIDKFKINVPFDTDLDKVKKIVREIGKTLAEDPEYAPHFIEPLKMQGVDQFGDFAMTIKLKMMTKPNEQFVIRRRAFAMLRTAFHENGIQFAVPTVQVAGGTEASAATAAASRQALQLVHPKPEPKA